MIKLPWTNATAPNVMLEVTSDCNLACVACYKKRDSEYKSLDRLSEELDQAMALRPLHTVAITGGEPTLHPDLPRIVAMIRARRVKAFLLTNGVLADAPLMDRLAAAGLDCILFHVDAGQARPDVAASEGFAAIRARIESLVELASRRGIDVSLSHTLYDDNPSALVDILRLYRSLSEPSFLFLARGVNLRRFHGRPDAEATKESVAADSHRRIAQIEDVVRRECEAEPYAFIPATDGASAVYQSWFAPVVFRGDETHVFPYRANRLEPWLMELPRLVTGKYVHKTTQNPVVTAIRVLLNGLSTLRPLELLRFLGHAVLPGAKLRNKMIAYDDGPFLSPSGEIVRCEYCPTPVLRDGKLVSCCEADYAALQRP